MIILQLSAKQIMHEIKEGWNPTIAGFHPLTKSMKHYYVLLFYRNTESVRIGILKGCAGINFTGLKLAGNID
jgi:hypothetical protein